MKGAHKTRKDKNTPFGVNLMRRQESYQAAQKLFTTPTADAFPYRYAEQPQRSCTHIGHATT